MDPITARYSTRATTEGYQIVESESAFYVVLSSWSQQPLGYGRCGAVVQAMAFAKRGAVMYGQVAIKYSHGVDQDGFLLHNEKLVLKRLTEDGGHPHIIKLVDSIKRVVVDDDVVRQAIVIEYVEGWTLTDVVNRWHANLWVLMDVIMLRWLIQIGDALAFMHSRGVAHNDLKAHNIMLTKDGKSVKIIDFGMSSRAREGEEPAWRGDMQQLGRVVAMLVAKRSPQARAEFEQDSSVDGCTRLLRTHASRYWGVPADLHRLMDGSMTAKDFADVMRRCKVRVLERQRVAAKRAKLDKVDSVSELADFLRGGSRPHLKSHEGSGGRISKL